MFWRRKKKKNNNRRELYEQIERKQQMSEAPKKDNTFEIHKPKKGDPTLNDVILNPETLSRIKDAMDFIKNKKAYEEIGAKLPSGILLYGSPGTGKTLTAKAIATECGYNFINANCSEFSDKYIGVASKRIRKLFKTARENTPCIIFMDEIDSIGSKRNNSGEGSDNERNNTLNALLAELDGFKENKDIFILASTNRLDSLDSALTRSGRFDRKINIDLPSKDNRKKIFELYLNKVKKEDGIKIDNLVALTTGSSGADIAKFVNEACIRAIREGRKAINMEDLDTVITEDATGLKGTIKLNDFDKKVTALHEVGHAVITRAFDKSKEVKKINIIPSEGSLGYVLSNPKEDRYLFSEEDLRNRIKTLMAGRVAEEIFFGKKFTGASNDLQRSTDIAINIVNHYGMIDDMLLVNHKSNDSKVMEYVINILNEEKEIVEKYIKENKDKIESIANTLYEKEELTDSEFEELFNEHNLPIV